MDGILPLWKPSGMTSHDCVMKVRKLFRTRKVGHTGTLDPEVEGVLPICIGQATKIVPFLTETKKRYVAEIMLGIATETEDHYGKITEQKEVVQPPTDSEIENTLQLFQGTITQVPPMYSAVKVNGKKLYEYARENIPVDRPSREVQIYHLNRLPLEKDNRFIKIEVVCSKGTYIRTLCVDIGKKLGYPAHMYHLVRMETGSIDEHDTIDFTTIEEAVTNGTENELLLPIVRGLTHLDKLYVDEHTKKRVLYGQKLPMPKQVMTTDPFVIMHEQELLAVYQKHPEHDHIMKAVRVFNG